MLSVLIRDTAVYGLAGILTRSAVLVLLPIYTRLLSPAEIGALDLLTVIASLVYVTVALEIAQGLARHYPDATSADDRRGYASSAFWFSVLMYSILLIVGLVAAPLVSEILLGSRDYVDVVRLATVATWLGGLYFLLLNQLRYDLRPAAYAVASITFTATSAVLAIALVAGAKLGLAGVYVGQIAGFVVGAAIALRSAGHQLTGGIDSRHLRIMLTFSLPLVPSSIAVIVLLSIDRLAINSLMGLEDVGVFGVAARIAQTVGLLMVAFQLALTPLIYQRHRDEAMAADLAQVFRYFVGLALFAWSGLSLFSTLIVTILATDQYAFAATLIPLLVPATLLANMYVFAPGLALARRTGVIAILNIGAACLNTGLNLAFIPVLGTAGAALATLTSAAFLFGGYMLLSQRLFHVPHHWVPIVLGTVLAAVAIAATFLVVPAGSLGFVLRLAILGGVAAGLMLVGLIRPAELAAGWRSLRRLRAT